MFSKNTNFREAGMMGLFKSNGGLLTYGILALAMIGFEMFNFSTTQVALSDLLGDLTFWGLQWATILAIAFCCIDFAGIGRLFYGGEGDQPAQETWFLFGAWLLAATMNALLTWWGVSIAMTGHALRSAEIIDQQLVLQGVPIFVAAMVWVTRILLIGSFSIASSRKTIQPVRQPVQRAPSTYRPTSTANAPQMNLAAQHRARASSTAPATSKSQHASRPYQPRSSQPLPAYQPRTAEQNAPARPQPLPMSAPRPITPPPAPAPLEPEYIPEGDANLSGDSIPSGGTHSTPSAIPRLRPLHASAHPTNQKLEGKF